MMRLSKEYQLELVSLPFSRGDNQVIFVESKFNPEINKFIESHIEDLKQLFGRHGLEFCYVPEVCERFWETSQEEWGSIPYDQSMLRTYGTHLATHQVFGESATSGEIPPSLICNTVGVRKENSIVFHAYHLDISHLDKEYLMIEQFRQIALAYSRVNALEYKEISADTETIEMLQEMERLARALKVKGVKADVFDQMIRSLEQPVAITVNHRGNIVLPNLGGITIRFNPMEKTLYNFFLRHLDGVLADELVGYRKALLNLYMSSSIYDSREAMEETLDSLLDEGKSTFYTNVSRIKTKLTKSLGPRLAAHYIIQKDSDGKYRIHLPQDMISWEGGAFEPK